MELKRKKGHTVKYVGYVLIVPFMELKPRRRRQAMNDLTPVLIVPFMELKHGSRSSWT